MFNSQDPCVEVGYFGGVFNYLVALRYQETRTLQEVIFSPPVFYKNYFVFCV
jgi:hypothetical protein